MVDKGVHSPAVSIALAIMVGLASPWMPLSAGAQNVASAQPAPANAPRRVTLNVEDAPLGTVVRVIAKQAGLVSVYNDALIPAKKRVTLHMRDVTADNAFQLALRGTGLTAQIQEEGHVVIVRGSANVLAGIVIGTVVDAATNKPISGASVMIADTKIGASSNEKGIFHLSGVPAGVRTLMVRRLGYRTATQSVTVVDGQTVNVRVAMTAASTALSEVVTTVSGERSRLEVGNSIGTIKASEIAPTTLLRNMSDLLTARTPGVVVSSPSGLVGSPSKIRIRGLGSIALSNDPVIIIDGMRMVSQSVPASTQTNVGSANMLKIADGTSSVQLAPSRLDDLDPNTIESIDILRGPSASSLYGTDAANGVIVIKTKRGVPGKWRATLSGDMGRSTPRGEFPELWYGWQHSPPSLVTSGGCSLAKLIFGRSVENGECVIDSVTHFQAQNDPRMRNIATGTSRSLGGDVSGGTEQLQQFLSLRVNDNIGGVKMSDYQKAFIARYWPNAAPSWMTRPNTERIYNGASRTTFQPLKGLSSSITANGIYRDVLNGGSALTTSSTVKGPWDTLTFLPAENQRSRNTNVVKRGFTAANMTYVPVGWLSTRVNLGGDYTMRTDESLLRETDCTPVVDYASGSNKCGSGHIVGKGETFVKTADIGFQLSFTPTSWLTSRTSFGEQYNGTQFYNLTAGNNTGSTDLSFGSDLLSPAPVQRSGTPQLYTVTETRDEGATAGWYLEQTMALASRFFFTAGFRRDAASAFGSQVNENAPVYPKVNMSWLISDEPFFPKTSFISSLRLRSAYGYSGTQASQKNVLGNFMQRRTIVEGVEQPGVLLGQLGNPDLKPEKTSEWEGGFDISLFSERIQLIVSQYRKLSKDAITNITLPPSYGVIGTSTVSFSSNLTQSVNLGSVENRGLEVSATVRMIDRKEFGWDLTVNAAKNRNKLVHKNPTLSATAVNGTLLVDGYPLYGYWGYPVTSYADLNNDHIVQRSEIAFGNLAYMGAPFPKSQVTYINNISLLNGSIRVNANFDQIFGLSNKFILTGANGTVGARGLVDATAPLGVQAAAIQAVYQGGFIGTTTSTRFSELSLTYVVPASLARRMLRTQSASVTFAGRNLALWSNYVGNDPNVDRISGTGFSETTSDDATGLPAPRQWALRFNIGF